MEEGDLKEQMLYWLQHKEQCWKEEYSSEEEEYEAYEKEIEMYDLKKYRNSF